MSENNYHYYREVIHLHVHGYSMGKIAKMVGISKTTVHTITHNWNRRVSAGNIEDIRSFLRNLRESGITIEDCIEGFRVKQMLMEFGIPDEPHDWMLRSDYTDSNINNILDNSGSIRPTLKEESLLDSIYPGLARKRTNEKKNTKKTNNTRPDLNPVSYFVQLLYRECKNHQISPTIAVKWITDMLGYFNSSSTTSSSFALFSPSNNQIPSDSPNDDHDNGNNNVVRSDNAIDSRYTSFPSIQTDLIANSVADIPLISKVSFFIDRKKNEIKRLWEIESEIKNRIQKIIEEKIKLESDVNDLSKKSEKKLGYFRWYDNLGEELSVKYNLNIENEIEAFSKLINDFKGYGYDPSRVILEYKSIESLNQAKIKIHEDISSNAPIRDHLLNQISYLKDQLYSCNQTINVYNELCNYGFGLKELKKLRQIFMEISNANNINPIEVGNKFLKDIEDQYDDKVGFENVINEYRMEKKKLKKEIPEYASTLKLQAIASTSLLFLHNNGVTNQHIISMRNLFLDFKNNDFLSDFVNDRYNDNSQLDSHYNYNNNNINKHNSKSENKDWDIFIQKLTELKNTNYKVKDQRLLHNNLSNENNELKIRKRNLYNLCLELSSLLNYLLFEISNATRSYNHICDRANRDMTMNPRFIPIFVYINTANDSNDEEK